MTISLVKIAHFYEDIPGFFWFEEAYRRLLETLPNDQPSTWVEVGCYHGRSMAWLGVEVINSGKPVHLHAVDSFVGLPEPPTEGLADIFRRNMAPIAEHLLDRFTIWPFTSEYAATQFADDSVDVVFLDGDHEYEAVKADITRWWAKLKPGGFMAGDDFQMKPVADAVIENFAPSAYILLHGWGNANGQMQPWPTWLARKA